MKKNNRIFVIVFYIVLINIFLAQSVFAFTLDETFKKRLPCKKGSLLRVSNTNGSISISSWDKDEIEIIAYKKVRASNRERAEKMMERLNIIITENKNEIEIETETPHGSKSRDGFFGWLFDGDNNSYSVEYEIKVPREIDLNINTTNGGVEIEEITGKLRLYSTNGNITGRRINGVVKSKTTNGSLRIEFDKVIDDEMSFSTTNGSIKLFLPRNFGGDVDLETTNGQIDSDFPLTVKNRWSKKHYRGKINDGDGNLNCSTTNGSIYLYYND